MSSPFFKGGRKAATGWRLPVGGRKSKYRLRVLAERDHAQVSDGRLAHQTNFLIRLLPLEALLGLGLGAGSALALIYFRSRPPLYPLLAGVCTLILAKLMQGVLSLTVADRALDIVPTGVAAQHRRRHLPGGGAMALSGAGVYVGVVGAGELIVDV